MSKARHSKRMSSGEVIEHSEGAPLLSMSAIGMTLRQTLDFHEQRPTTVGQFFARTRHCLVRADSEPPTWQLFNNKTTMQGYPSSSPAMTPQNPPLPPHEDNEFNRLDADFLSRSTEERKVLAQTLCSEILQGKGVAECRAYNLVALIFKHCGSNRGNGSQQDRRGYDKRHEKQRNTATCRRANELCRSGSTRRPASKFRMFASPQLQCSVRPA